MITLRIRVVGKVQGVFFRASTKNEADKLGLKGWVRNEPDGSVLIEVSGTKEVVDQLLDWCHRGPMMAVVKEVSTEELPYSTYEDFSITA